MIRMIQSKSESHAKAYFSDALTKSDYYINDQELAGRLQGRLGERLGLNGRVDKETFFALCENRNPKTGGSLTPRTRQVRRVGYDINFHAPKSVSIVHALSRDSHIADAFQASVNQVMQAMEADCQTRVRKGGAFHNRATSELLWTEFMHQTARPIDGQPPDPHLHMHCFTFNMTWDAEEKEIKAGDFAEIKRDMPYYQALFHKVFSDKLIEQGYNIRKTAKSFEIEGVPKAVIDLFSKRTDEIGQYAKAKGITDPKKLDEVGARIRSAKQKGLTMTELLASWKTQIKNLKGVPAEEKHKSVRHAKTPFRIKITPENCRDYAVQHSFERVSVRDERRLLESALRHGIGDAKTSSDAIAFSVHSDNRIIKVFDKGRLKCTTKKVLAEEKEMVDLARMGLGNALPLYDEPPRIKLEGQQERAVRHILTTKNRISIIRGAAGAGKTKLMKVAVPLIEKTGKQVFIFAPTADASRGVLVKEGFKNANTVASILKDKEKQRQLNGQVMWIDEAGLLGTTDMLALLKLAKEQKARLILGGDTRQHASVVRGDALRILNTVAGIKTAEVNKIYRQQNDDYKEAVYELSKGNIKSGFEKLDTIGMIKTIDPLNPDEALVNDYMDAINSKTTALIISPTHKQGEKLTDAIRERMKTDGKIGKREIGCVKLTNLNLTEAQKTDTRNYEQGQVVRFTQNMRRIKRGSEWVVQKLSNGEVKILNKKGDKFDLPKDKPRNFEVFGKSLIQLAKGDKIKITHNNFDEKKRRMDNGQMLEVFSLSKMGKVVLRNPVSKATYHVRRDFGHMTHAYCSTSHSSQGKTVDHVFISQPASTFEATNAKQFYVSASRGKYSAKIYTDDKEALLEYASQMGDRQSAIELVDKGKMHFEAVIDKQRKEYVPPKITPKKKEISKPSIEREYEL